MSIHLSPERRLGITTTNDGVSAQTGVPVEALGCCWKDVEECWTAGDPSSNEAFAASAIRALSA